MGREIKRVPLDFDFPINGRDPWPGYLRDCGDMDCEGCPACERQDPPEGDGWQLWQTTSEGSPITPVFSTAEDLARHMSTQPVGFAGSRIDYATALEWCRGAGWSPSMISHGGRLEDGITGMTRL